MASLEIIRIIFGFILVLFIPGFALSWALFPHREDLTKIERLAYSFVLSLLSVILGILFMDVKLGLEVTTTNILIVITFIVLFSILAYAIQIIVIEAGMVQKLAKGVRAVQSTPSFQSIKEKIVSKNPFKKMGKQENEKL